MKKLVVLFGVLTFLIGSCLPGKIVKLKIPTEHQTTNYTCWAASISMVVSYVKNFSVSDCEVVSHVNRLYNWEDRCCTEKSKQCLRGGYTHDLMAALEHVFMINYHYANRPLAWNEIVEAIDAGQPIIALRMYPMGGGHANVIIGYDEVHHSLIVAEPTLGREQSFPYDSFTGNLWTGIWVGSFVITSKPAEKRTCKWNCEVGVGCHVIDCAYNPGDKPSEPDDMDAL